jgi:bifunctional non-homologous end joining protein LigD
MIKPMLASPMKKGNIVNWSEWAVEEKFDGHRLIVHVNRGYDVQAHARPRGKTDRMIERVLPDHLRADLGRLPTGVYDGELLAGDTGTDVSRLDLAHERTFVVFDVLEMNGLSLTSASYDERRGVLLDVFDPLKLKSVTLATSANIRSIEDVTRFVQAVWKRDGEGTILKRRASHYAPDKRNGDWVKIKRCEHAILTVIGFEPTRGTTMNRGPFAVVKLRDDDGNETTCKTLNDYELAKFNNATEHSRQGFTDSHPAIGRKLVIEFPRRTRTGGYQGPVIWDRWENE